MNKLLTRQEFGDKNHFLCNFVHIFEDQKECFDCGGQPDNCIGGNGCQNINDAFENYKKPYTDSEAIFVMMTAQ